MCVLCTEQPRTTTKSYVICTKNMSMHKCTLCTTATIAYNMYLYLYIYIYFMHNITALHDAIKPKMYYIYYDFRLVGACVCRSPYIYARWPSTLCVCVCCHVSYRTRPPCRRRRSLVAHTRPPANVSIGGRQYQPKLIFTKVNSSVVK